MQHNGFKTSLLLDSYISITVMQVGYIILLTVIGEQYWSHLAIG